MTSDLAPGEEILRKGGATLYGGWLDPAGQLRLTNRRLRWKRARADFAFGGPSELDIPLKEIDVCVWRGRLGFYTLLVVAKGREFLFAPRGGLFAPLLILHRRTTKEWHEAITDALAARSD